MPERTPEAELESALLSAIRFVRKISAALGLSTADLVETKILAREAALT